MSDVPSSCKFELLVKPFTPRLLDSTIEPQVLVVQHMRVRLASAHSQHHNNTSNNHNCLHWTESTTWT